ncbi:MAG: glycosyltransferase [Gemmatimonadota bacterium]
MARRPLHIAGVANDLATAAEPHRGAFVVSLFDAFRAAGAETTLIVPRPPWRRDDSTLGPGRVFRPRYLPVSNRTLPGGGSSFRWTAAHFARAAARASRRLASPPTLAYGHFLYPAGWGALAVAGQWTIPAVVALGESSLAYYERRIGLERVRRASRHFAGVLAVSEANRAYCINRLGVDPARIVVIPNAADPAHFHPADKTVMRERLGLPVDRPIVAFVGHFTERKGPQRVLAALAHLPEVGAIFLGAGPDEPTGPQVLFRGLVPNTRVHEWLSAADCFVLPTLAEGSSNAVAEALAVGLPVIASDIPGVREMVGPDAGLLVDPLDEAGLAAALRTVLQSSGVRDRLSAAARSRAEAFTLPERARRILDWIDTSVLSGGVA